MKRTIREWREDCGESRSDLAAALGVSLQTIMDWELGQAEPTISRLRTLTEHFDVRDDQIKLRPKDPPSFGDRLAELFG
jgi:transcriptional regulator with XRE-family HTH domain